MAKVLLIVEDDPKDLVLTRDLLQSSGFTTIEATGGELDMGITIDYTVRKLLKGNPSAPIDYVYPEAGVVMVPSPIAIFKHSQNIEVAKVFVRYILSKKGHAIFTRTIDNCDGRV